MLRGFTGCGLSLVAAVLALSVSLPAPSSEAAPVLVRARAELTLSPRRAGDGGWSVVGGLVDDSGQPIASEVVVVALGDCAEHTAQTASDGAFAVKFPANELKRCGGERLTLSARFGGSSRYGEAASEGTYDRRRGFVSVQLDARPDAVAVGEALSLQASAYHAGAPLTDAELTFAVGAATLGKVRTRSDGSAAVTVTVAAGWPRGLLPVRVGFAGTDHLNAASAARTLRVYAPPRLTLDGTVDEEQVQLAGSLEDDVGAPVSDAIVTVSVRADENIVLTTDSAGRFSARRALADLSTTAPGQQLRLRARYPSDRPALGDARSPELVLEIPTPATVPTPYYVWPLVGLVVALLALGPGLGGIWRHLQRAFLALRPRRREDGTSGGPSPLVLADPSHEPTAPLSWRLRVRTWDEDRDRAVAGARAELRAPEPANTSGRGDDDGWLVLEARVPGRHELVVSADGYDTARVGVTLPHDGGMDGARLNLRPVRARARDLFRDLIRRRLPRRPRAWGRRSARELRTELGGALPGGESAADAVVDRFEAAYWGRPERPEEAVEALATSITDAERGGAGSASRDSDKATRPDTPAGGALAVALLAAALGLLAGTPSARADDYDPNDRSWSGLSYLGRTAAEAHCDLFPIERLDWDEIARDDVLLFLFPSGEVDPDSLEAFVGDGGRVILADDFGASEPLLKRFGLLRAPVPPDHGRFAGGAPGFPQFSLPPAEDHFLGYRGSQSGPLVANHPSALLPVQEWSDTLRPIVSYGGMSGAALVVEVKHGEGTLVVIADASLFINEMLQGVHSDKQFVANVLRYFCPAEECRVGLVLPHATWTGRYRPGPPPVTDLSSFFRASIQTLDGLVARFDRWLRTNVGARGLALLAAGVLGLAALGTAVRAARRPPPIGPTPARLAAGGGRAELRAATLGRASRGDYREPLRLLLVSIQRPGPHQGAFERLADDIRAALERPDRRRRRVRVSAAEFRRFWDEASSIRAVAVGADLVREREST